MEWQRQEKWDKEKGQKYRSLSELNIGILGVGEIGKIAARLFKVSNKHLLNYYAKCTTY